MTYYFPNVDPIYLYKRKGSDEDPFLYLEEERYVKNSSITLNEIPSHNDGVKVFKENGEEMIEVSHDSLDINEFRVDYTTGVVHFNNVMNGQKVIIKYYGTGYVDIPTTRIRIPSSDDDPLETLQDTLDKVQDGIKTLEQLGSLEFLDNYNPEYHYKKWNFVNYEGKTYVAVQDNIGENPETSSSWKFVSGGVSVKGVYNPQYIYGINDVVANEEKTKLYLSKISNNTYPLTDTNAWMEIIDLDNAVNNMINIIDQQINQLNALKQELIESEEQRDLREDERDIIFNDRLSQLELFKEDINEEEQQRQSNEIERQNNELLRNSNEENRQNNEIQRQNNEVQRQNNEQAREQRINMLINNSEVILNQIQEAINEMSNMKNIVDDLVNTTQDNLNQTNEYINELNELKHLGEYNSEIEYKKYNIVTYNGSSYMALQDSFNILPTNEEYWRLIASKGNDGDFITVEGVQPDENGNISLESLDIIRESQLNEQVNNINLKIGDLSRLKTIRKDDLVEAINELKTRIDDIIDIIS